MNYEIPNTTCDQIVQDFKAFVGISEVAAALIEIDNRYCPPLIKYDGGIWTLHGNTFVPIEWNGTKFIVKGESL